MTPVVRWLIVALLVVSLPELFAPPTSPTMWRQTQTAMLSEHFAHGGFRLSALTVTILGAEPAPMVYEFPLYNFIVGAGGLLFGSAVFWGKLVSLACAVVCLVHLVTLVTRWYGERVALWSGICFFGAPVGVQMFASVQPDMLALALLLTGVHLLLAWKDAGTLGTLALACAAVLAAGLAKWTLLVPWVPLMVTIAFAREGRWAFPRVREIAIAVAILLVPMVAWYAYRSNLTHEIFEARTNRSIFLIGDLARFTKPAFYFRPAAHIAIGVLSGIGAIFFALGIWRTRSRLDYAILLAIPLYYLVVPTVADQPYYLLAALPLFAIVTGRGIDAASTRLHRPVAVTLGVAWGAAFVVAAQYMTRQDDVMRRAGDLLRQSTDAGDLVVAATMHDRTIGVGGLNPALFYLGRRSGWNVLFSRTSEVSADRILAQATAHQGAEWLVVTWYTPDLETWFTRLLPATFRRQPPVDGAAISANLSSCLPVHARAPNVLVLGLSGAQRCVSLR